MILPITQYLVDPALRAPTQEFYSDIYYARHVAYRCLDPSDIFTDIAWLSGDSTWTAYSFPPPVMPKMVHDAPAVSDEYRSTTCLLAALLLEIRKGPTKI